MFIVISFLAVPESRRVIGTLARRARMLTTYAFYVRWSIGVQLILDGLHLWAFFSQSRQTLIDRCVDGSTDQEVLNICEQSFDTGKWTLVISMVIGLIIQICECFPPPVGGLGKRGGKGVFIDENPLFFSRGCVHRHLVRKEITGTTIVEIRPGYRPDARSWPEIRSCTRRPRIQHSVNWPLALLPLQRHESLIRECSAPPSHIASFFLSSEMLFGAKTYPLYVKVVRTLVYRLLVY